MTAVPVSMPCYLGLHHDEGADRCNGMRLLSIGEAPCECRCHIGHAEHRT